MKTFTTLVLILAFAHTTMAQTALTLEECYERALANYPLIRERGLIHQTLHHSVENASKGSLPRISFGGQASYQSEVTEIPVEMPGIEPLNKDQYRVFSEISQPIYQGGLVRQQKLLENTKAMVDEQKLDVALYEIKGRINELFFGIILLQDQGIQSGLVRKDLVSGLRKVEAAIANGTAIPSGADMLRAEILSVDQRILEIRSAERSYREALGLFTGLNADSTMKLIKPVFSNAALDINRPELKLFEYQKQNIESNRALVSAMKKPRLELFLQGGFGRPGLNMLENEFNFYYLGGIRFSWSLSALYTSKTENQIFNLRQQSLDVQKATFLFNTGVTLNQQEEEITKFQRLILIDNEIIALRRQVRQTAEAQLEEGVITSSDFIREVNAEDQAIQNRALHETQMLLAQAKHQFTAGQ